MQDFDPVVLDQAVEQMATLLDTLLDTLSDMTQSYYDSLLEGGIPDDLARLLVRDWHSIYWQSLLRRP